VTATFRRTRHGEVVAHLHPEEVSLLRRLPDDLRPVIDAPSSPARGADPLESEPPAPEQPAPEQPAPDPLTTAPPAGAPPAPDPIRERLFPRAYLDPTEEESEGEWQRMVHPELVRSKLEALALLGASLERARSKGGGLEVVLSPEEVEAWLGALNDARLALGVALDITEERVDELISPDDPAAPGLAVYTWLTGLQGELVDTLLG
jgi:hypothetical protein